MHETEESGAFRPVILACRTLELELLEDAFFAELENNFAIVAAPIFPS